ncbi:MAG TPA: hypothetical protein VFD36_29290 [Kofleriaceae bacterium]|nr:hypothetical protein [Kofleriaceae bacterium]
MRRLSSGQGCCDGGTAPDLCCSTASIGRTPIRSSTLRIGALGAISAFHRTSGQGCCDGGTAPDLCCSTASIGRTTIRSSTLRIGALGNYQHGNHTHKTLWGNVSNPVPVMASPVRAQPMGHTAYHHVGLGYVPMPAAPYYRFGYQGQRFPGIWAGGQGGVAWDRRAAETRELGNEDLLESGLEAGGPFLPFRAFARTMVHDPRYVPHPSPTGDWPLVRRAGPEPVGLSDNEKKLGIVLALGAVGFMIWKKMGKRKNPARFKYQVVATTKRRRKKRRRRYGAIGFKTVRAAEAYADYLRKGGHKARVRKASRK